MILDKLILENFRQFRGRQEIEFSDLKDCNVTLIHAENGFGKTALLNAMLWGFYGHDGLTEDLPKKEFIIHEATAVRAGAPETTAARVAIWFTHDGEKYCLTRELTLEQQRLDSRKSDLSLEQFQDGMPHSIKFPQQKIQSMMPIGISNFLFFNGERIDHLAMEENAALITDAIRQMLGLKLIQTAIDDLQHQNVRGKLRAELRERTSEEKQAKIDQQTEVDEAIEEFNKRRETNQKNLAAVDSEIATVNAKLELNREAHQLQVQRAQLEKQRDGLIDRLGTLSKRLGQIIAEDSYALFAEGLVARGKEIIGKLRSEGKIPARVLNSFLQELLDSHRCICGRHLDDGSSERKIVERLMTYAGDAQFNSAVGALDNAIGRVEESIGRTRESLLEVNRDRLTVQDNLKVIREELENIHQTLGGRDDEEISTLEQKRETLLLKQRELLAEQGKNELRHEELVKTRDQLKKEIEEIEESEADAQKAQRRLKAVEDAAALLQRILDIETQELRPELNKEIKNHFAKIIDRPYWPELSGDFRLRILHDVVVDETKNETTDVALSTGQRQVTSLVFIASLVALARRRSEIPSIVRGLSGSRYPMVMDSPFGQLGVLFREGVARWIPSLAPQVVILVSHTQFNGPVEDELKKSKRVGRRYYLAYHGPEVRKDADTELTLGRSKYQVYQHNREEFTEICEIDA
jgi:DNA sulfur modification protein DndD